MGVLMESARHVGLDAIVAVSTWVSLHESDPGTNGANEISGGSPAYARQEGTFGAASAGERALSADLTFNVPAGATVAWVGVWSAETGGTFRGKHQLAGAEAYVGQGTFVVQAANTKFSIQDS